MSEIAAIVAKDKDGTITQEDRSRLGLLDDLRKILDRFADVHNAYIDGLKIWETSGTRPSNLDELSGQMISMIRDAEDLAKRLNIKVR